MMATKFMIGGATVNGFTVQSSVDLCLNAYSLAALIMLLPLGIASIVQCARRDIKGISSATVMLVMFFVVQLVTTQFMFAHNMFATTTRIELGNISPIAMRQAWERFILLAWLMLSYLLFMFLSVITYAVKRNFNRTIEARQPTNAATM